MAFRSFLKFGDIPSDELDSIVHRIADEVSSQINCTQCANCCKVIQPLLSEEDTVKFAKGLQLTPSIFKQDHLIPDGEQKGKFTFNAQPCPFLADDLCTNYDARPQDCSSFPHLYKRNFRG